MNNKEDALINFEVAYLIYLNWYPILQANAAFQIASIMEEHWWLEDALVYATNSYETYTSQNGDQNEMSIASLWLVISISYALKI